MQDTSEQMTRALLQTTQKILELLYQKLAKRDLSSKEKALMKKMLNGNGPVVGSAVIKSHLSKVKEELIKNNVPYFPLPDGQGNTILLVRKEYEAKLLEIEEHVCMQDTSLAKELSSKNILDIAKSQKIKNIITLSFNDVKQAEIAKQKLFQSGQVFQSSIINGKSIISVFPTIQFKSTGKDLELFKLNYALIQARNIFKKDGEAESELIVIRKQQADFDNNQIKKFVELAVNKEHVVLGGAKGCSLVYIEATDGEIVIHNRIKHTEETFKYDNSDSLKDMMSSLSRYTEDIYNMEVIDADYYYENMRDKTVRISDLKPPYSEYKRPSLPQDHELYNVYDLMSKDYETLMKDINYEATARVMVTPKYERMSNEEKAILKHKEIGYILKDKGNPIMIDFFKKTSISPVSLEEKQAIIDDIYENFSNEAQNTRHSVDVSKMSLTDYQKMINEDENTKTIQEAIEEKEV